MHMTTQEIADKLVAYCKAGDYKACYAELYSPQVQSLEPDGTICNGLEEMAVKGKEWNDNIEEFNSSSVGDAVVAGNFFSIPMSMNVKFKNAPAAVDFHEICVYQVKDGKVVKEQFFYDQMH